MVKKIKLFLDLQKVQLSTPSEHNDKPASTCFEYLISCNNVKRLNIAMYITYGIVFGGTLNILIFGVFLENESNFGRHL